MIIVNLANSTKLMIIVNLELILRINLFNRSGGVGILVLSCLGYCYSFNVKKLEIQSFKFSCQINDYRKFGKWYQINDNSKFGTYLQS